MSDIDVRLEGVGKRYRLGTRRDAPEFWALRDITFDVRRGTSVGVIGRNGAGKSTLLKLLSGITAPSAGRIRIEGRLAALIEVGSGFHPELTGRENVFLSGAMLGMRRRELSAQLDSIVEFAGVERFVDTPVKWYSSGMYVRLGFSIAAHLHPDILLVDEVLAVGDAEFQSKCLARIRQLQREGVTTIFISHDLTAVEHLCDSAVLLEGGRVVQSGVPAAVIADYHRRISSAEAASGNYSEAAREGAMKITNLTFASPEGHRALGARTGEPLVVTVRYAAARPFDRVVIELSYYTGDGATLVARASTARRTGVVDVQPPGGAVQFVCQALPFKPGAYYIDAVIRDARSGDVIDWWDGGTRLHVSGDAVEGQLYALHTWRRIEADEAVAATQEPLRLAE
jgi:lipopolysaccharide transport system ATP-binding protein